MTTRGCANHCGEIGLITRGMPNCRACMEIAFSVRKTKLSDLRPDRQHHFPLGAELPSSSFVLRPDLSMATCSLCSDKRFRYQLAQDSTSIGVPEYGSGATRSLETSFLKVLLTPSSRIRLSPNR